MNQALRAGDFVRVKAEGRFRPGQDGMVIDGGAEAAVGLVFQTDRYGRDQSETGAVITGLVEAWNLNELDLASVER